jgi:hypothetical protein
MIQIENLTPYQCEMLDTMWEMETESEYFAWYELLDREDQLLAEALQCLIILESMEPSVVDTTVAALYLKKFQLQ